MYRITSMLLDAIIDFASFAISVLSFMAIGLLLFPLVGVLLTSPILAIVHLLAMLPWQRVGFQAAQKAVHIRRQAKWAWGGEANGILLFLSFLGNYICFALTVFDWLLNAAGELFSKVAYGLGETANCIERWQSRREITMLRSIRDWQTSCRAKEELQAPCNL